MTCSLLYLCGLHKCGVHIMCGLNKGQSPIKGDIETPSQLLGADLCQPPNKATFEEVLIRL